MSNTQGGLMSGIIFGVYALSVLVLVTATDRYQARRIYLIGGLRQHGQPSGHGLCGP